MTALAVAGVLAMLGTGTVLFKRLQPRDLHGVPAFALGLCVVPILGAALHSAWFVLWVLLTNASQHPWAYLAFDACLPVIVFLVSHLTRRRGTVARDVTADEPGRDEPHERMGRVVVAVGLAYAVALAVYVVVMSAAQPHGGWDAWAMWNLKARWLALAGESWRDIIVHPSFAQTSRDYPLLLPSTIARFWVLANGVPTATPQTVAAGSVLLAIGLVSAFALYLRGRLAAVAAAAAFVIIPMFVQHAAWQYADVPLSCFYAATLGFVACGVERGGESRWFALAGLTGGAALWTKNEGIPFAAIVLVVIGLTSIRRRRVAGMRGLSFVAGALPFVIATATMKLQAGAPSDIVAHAGRALWRPALDLSRHVEILSFGLNLLRVWPEWIPALLFAGFVLAQGVGNRLTAFTVLATSLTLTAGAYYAALLFGAPDLTWRLDTAGGRLFLHLWPSLILAAILLGPTTAHNTPGGPLPASGAS